MRELFYYQDAMIQHFTAQVVRTGFEDARPFMVLSNTAFYPTGGGQAHDTGIINDLAVVDVEKVDGEIRHYVEAEDFSAVEALVGSEVTGCIDWERRFDHMQQHCGQHILTAAFVELFDFPTVSFHLGTELVSIDIAAAQLTDEQLAQVEKRANEIVLENRPIETKWVSKEELSNYHIRKDVSVNEDIRLVIIPDYDYNGCGGTHPTSTGQVSMIKIMGTEKMKKNTRVSFVCGNRVLSQLAMRKTVLSDVARQLSVPEEAAAEALRKVFNDNKQTEKALDDARNQLLEYEAKELVAASVGTGIVAASFDNRSVQTLQKLGRAVVSELSDCVCLLVSENEDKLQFIAARGSGVEKSMKEISGAILPLVNGKGGGNDAFVQGGGEKCLSAEELLGEMKKLV